MNNKFGLARRLAAEGLGTAFLVAIVIGSGIMGDRLADGHAAVALLGNTLATGAGLVTLIIIFGSISGAHFNPVVSAFFVLQGALSWRDGAAYGFVQICGGIIGAALAHIMFGLPLVEAASTVRTGTGIWVGEVVATFGLLLTIIGCLKNRPEATPYAVGLFIMAGYWFTSSTSFANPAVTIARALTDTFSGIRPQDVGGFVLAQIFGCLLAALTARWFWKPQACR